MVEPHFHLIVKTFKTDAATSNQPDILWLIYEYSNKFQTAFVSASTTPETSPVGIALYDFHGEADNELTFSAGDHISLEQTVEGAEDWSWGVFQGTRGMFPTSFVELL